MADLRKFQLKKTYLFFEKTIDSRLCLWHNLNMKRTGHKPKTRKAVSLPPKDNKMTPSANETEQTVPTVTVKRNVFDLDKFERVTLEKEIELRSVASVEEMNAAADSDEEKVVKIFNTGYRRHQIAAAKAEMGGESIVSPKIVSGFVNNFKPLYPPKNDSPEARKEQLQKIYAFIRATPALLDSIKQIAAAMKAAGADEEDEDNETESE